MSILKTNSLPSDLLEQAAQLISEADALFITAGAGMGGDSGLPDFRGSNGLWKSHSAIEGQELSFYDIALNAT